MYILVQNKKNSKNPPIRYNYATDRKKNYNFLNRGGHLNGCPIWRDLLNFNFCDILIFTSWEMASKRLSKLKASNELEPSEEDLADEDSGVFNSGVLTLTTEDNMKGLKLKTNGKGQ